MYLSCEINPTKLCNTGLLNIHRPKKVYGHLAGCPSAELYWVYFLHFFEMHTIYFSEILIIAYRLSNSHFAEVTWG